VLQLIIDGAELISRLVNCAKQIVVIIHKMCTTPLIADEISKKLVLGIHTVHGEIQDVKIALKKIAWHSLFP